MEFNGTGGIKYLRNNDDYVFFTGGNIFCKTNNIQKMPVLLKREINKLSSQKKLIIEEKYNYEEKYEAYQNIILYYAENRIDFSLLFDKLNMQNSKHIKDITNEFTLMLTVPGIDDVITYKKYAGKQEYKNLFSKLLYTNYYESENASESDKADDIVKTDKTDKFDEFDKNYPILDSLEYFIIKCVKNKDIYMTVYPDKNQILKYKNKSLCFSVPNLNLNQDKIYINLTIYLEKYKLV